MAIPTIFTIGRWGTTKQQQFSLGDSIPELSYQHQSKVQMQGWHLLEKYLNIQDCIENSLKIKFALKVLVKRLKGLERSFNSCLWRPKLV